MIGMSQMNIIPMLAATTVSPSIASSRTRLWYSAALVAVLVPAASYARAPIVAPAPIPKVSIEVAEVPSGDAPAGEVTLNSSGLDPVAARERLMEQLLRAAQAGIVDLKPEEPATEADSPVTESAVADAESNDPLPDAGDAMQPGAVEPVEDEAANAGLPSDPQAPPDGSNGVSDVATGQDTAEQDDGSHFRVTVQSPVDELSDNGKTDSAEDEDARKAVARPPARCFTREQLTLPDIYSADQLARTIGDLRKQLVGEFDRSDEDTAVQLAKIYLSVGMFEEARHVLLEYAPAHAFGFYIQDTIDVVLGDDAHRDGSLFKDECIGLQALWRAYAQARLGDADAALRSEVSSGAALQDLPLYPRQLIASELGLIAASAGRWDTVRRLEAMARRAANGSGETLGKTHLLSYRYATWREDPNEAAEHLALARDSDVDTATEALLIMGERALASEDVLGKSQKGLMTDLGDLARQAAGTTTGRRAFELEARLFHRQADAADTIELLSDAVDFGILDAGQYPAFLSELLSTPAYSEVERPLAHIYLDDPERFQQVLDQPELRKSLVLSLAREGVPKMAKQLSASEDLSDSNLAIELADSFLDADEPREAIEVLSKTDDGAEQRMLLSRAFLAMGDFEKATNTLEDVEDLASPEEELPNELANVRLTAELAGKDFAAALETSEKRLRQQRDAPAAADLALIALQSGVASIPEDARDVLQESDQESLSEFETLYSLGEGASLEGVSDLEEIDEILKEIEAGESVISEIVENG